MGNPSQDIHPPKMDEAKKHVHKHEKNELDEALKDSFPASDPPAMTEPHKHLGRGNNTGQADKNPGGSTGTGSPKN